MQQEFNECRKVTRRASLRSPRAPAVALDRAARHRRRNRRPGRRHGCAEVRRRADVRPDAPAEATSACRADIAILGRPVRHRGQLPPRRPLRSRSHQGIVAAAAPVQPGGGRVAVRRPAGGGRRRPRRQPVRHRRGHRHDRARGAGPARAGTQAAHPRRRPHDRPSAAARGQGGARPGRGRPLRRSPGHLGHLFRRRLHARHPVPPCLRGGPPRRRRLPARRHPRPPVRRRRPGRRRGRRSARTCRGCRGGRPRSRAAPEPDRRSRTRSSAP